MAFSEKLREALVENFKSKGLNERDAIILTGLKQIEKFDKLSPQEKKQMKTLENKLNEKIVPWH
jgi:hypothetical protein